MASHAPSRGSIPHTVQTPVPCVPCTDNSNVTPTWGGGADSAGPGPAAAAAAGGDYDDDNVGYNMQVGHNGVLGGQEVVVLPLLVSCAATAVRACWLAWLLSPSSCPPTSPTSAGRVRGDPDVQELSPSC